MSYRKLAVTALLALILATVPAQADDDRDRALEAPATRVESLYPPETRDDPQGALRPRQDRGARTPGLTVQQGSYVSVQVNVDEFGQNIVGDAANEPSISVDLLNHDRMVVGWRQFDTISSNFRQAGWAYTQDGGASWTHPGVLQPGVFRSDPVIAVDDSGVFYYQSLKETFDMDVWRSLDGGVTWLPPVDSFGGDKNWMVIDTTGGLGNGNVYGIWQRFFGCCDRDVLTRSIDGGDSYEFPVEIEKWPTFGAMAIGPDGEVYSVGIDGTSGQDTSTIVAAVSTNAPNPAVSPTFSGVEVPLGGSMRFSSGPNPAGLLGQINVAVDRRSGPTRGYAYLVASVNPPGSDPLDVKFSRSVDGGATWSPGISVNDDNSNSNWQWFGTVGVAPTGRIDVIWNDTRNTGASNLSQLFYSYSLDQGTTWATNVPVSPVFDSLVGFPQQNKIGDYYDIKSDSTGADVIYSATFNGEQDVYYVRLFPDCNLNAVSDPVDITQGTSFDCNLNGVPDECEQSVQCLGSATVPDGKFLPGTPLTVNPAAGDELLLNWGASCGFGDGDFEIYEGTLGDFDSHAAIECTTGGQPQATITPDAGSTYYLIVPTNGDQEGSYGRESSGDERPAGMSTCRPQVIRPCIDPGG